MQLGAFSVSLSVADLAASRAFYEHLGFQVMGGDAGHFMLRDPDGNAILVDQFPRAVLDAIAGD